jgi:hypothetical protein
MLGRSSTVWFQVGERFTLLGPGQPVDGLVGSAFAFSSACEPQRIQPQFESVSQADARASRCFERGRL